MRAAITFGLALAVTIAACSGATDPKPEPLDAGTSSTSSSSSSSGATAKPDSGPRSGPSVTPGQIACGASSCASPSVCCVDGANAECKASADDCSKEAITCDELADCDEGFCCAEESTQTPLHVSTYCRPTCITGLPRVEVCVSNEECASGKCQVYSCGGYDMKGVKTCAPLGECP